VWGEANKTCDLLKSSEKTCWGVSGPPEPEVWECKPCQEEEEQFVAVESVELQAPVNSFWNMTAGEEGSEIWRLEPDSACCGSVALGSKMYPDIEFSGSFSNIGTDDD
jgi:hypothetical protein